MATQNSETLRARVQALGLQLFQHFSDGDKLGIANPRNGRMLFARIARCVMSNVPKKLTSLAHDVAFRLGVEAQIQATHERHEVSYALAFHELSLVQVKDLLDWLDYYVPTLDEQKATKRGPMGDEVEGQPIPRRKAGAS